MPRLNVCLFGELCIRWNDEIIPGIGVRKAEELFSYLLLYRYHRHAREVLAGLLWGESAIEQARKYLRQALWQLQAALNPAIDSAGHGLLMVEPDWVGLNPQVDLWLDVAMFERAFSVCEGVPAQALDAQGAQSLEKAVQLYRGELMHGCYIDWCLCERERLQAMYIAMLDKLMVYGEIHHEYEVALGYGTRILSCDRASERTHRRLMRLNYLAGDRTAALRQYERCVAALDEELGAGPSRRTQALCEQIRADQVEGLVDCPTETEAAFERGQGPLSDVREGLARLLMVLDDLQHQVQEQMAAVERALTYPH